MNKVTLGNKEYKINLTLETLCDYEDQTGKSFFNQKDMQNMKAKDMKVLLWASIDKQIPLDEIGKLVSFKDLKNVVEGLIESINEEDPAGK